MLTMASVYLEFSVRSIITASAIERCKADILGVDRHASKVPTGDTPLLRRTATRAGTPRAGASRHRSPGLQPSLSHGAFDNMPLNPSAMRAGKGSQVLAQRARLNRRQLHW